MDVLHTPGNVSTEIAFFWRSVRQTIPTPPAAPPPDHQHALPRLDLAHAAEALKHNRRSAPSPPLRKLKFVGFGASLSGRAVAYSANAPTPGAEHLVARPEPRDGVADRLNGVPARS